MSDVQSRLVNVILYFVKCTNKTLVLNIILFWHREEATADTDTEIRTENKLMTSLRLKF